MRSVRPPSAIHGSWALGGRWAGSPRGSRPSPGAYALAAAGLTQARLAEHLGVDTSSVSLYMAGHVRLHERMRSALCELVGEKQADDILAEARPARAENEKARSEEREAPTIPSPVT
jgi:helix-turn-helix protein